MKRMNQTAIKTALIANLAAAGLLVTAGCDKASPVPSVQASTATAAAPNAGKSGDKPVFRSLTAADINKLAGARAAAGKPGIWLDVRTPGEVARGHIEGASAVSISSADFARKVSRMQRNKPIFVYCASGSRSMHAGRLLQRMGFAEVYNLSGGIMAWRRAGLPVDRSAMRHAPAAAMTPAAFDKLIAAGKPVLADFHSPWCAPCKRMAPIVDKLEAAHRGKAAIVRIDVDASTALADREKISGIPVFVLYVGGKETWRHSGELSEAALSKRIEATLKR